jgi:Rrf2 family protein
VIKINRQTDYAIRVLLALAKQPEGTRLATSAIGEEMLIPRAFLTRIVADLAQAELVETFPGRDGGLQLARPAAQISLRDVVETMGGPFLLSDCMTEQNTCPFEGACPVRTRWSRLQRVILDELAHTTLDILALEAINVSGPVIVLPVNS